MDVIVCAHLQPMKCFANCGLQGALYCKMSDKTLYESDVKDLVSKVVDVVESGKEIVRFPNPLASGRHSWQLRNLTKKEKVLQRRESLTKELMAMRRVLLRREG